MTSAVSFRAAQVDLGDRTVWRDVDLEIAPGEFVAILGPNGAGKSTMLNAILGLVPVAAGEVRVLDRAPGEARAEIGYLPQRHAFDPSLRIRGVDIVRLGLDGDRWGIPLPGARSRNERARVAELVALVGAEDYATRPIGQCSGGCSLGAYWTPHVRQINAVSLTLARVSVYRGVIGSW